jgi:hypothetical protein
MTTFPESHRDLLDTQVATLDADGSPQRNPRARPQCSLLR